MIEEILKNPEMVEALINEAEETTTIYLNNFQELKEEIDKEIARIKEKEILNILKTEDKYVLTILKS